MELKDGPTGAIIAQQLAAFARFIERVKRSKGAAISSPRAGGGGRALASCADLST